MVEWLPRAESSSFILSAKNSTILERGSPAAASTPPESPMVFTRSSLFNKILFPLNLLVFAFLSLPADGATIIYRWPWSGVFQMALGLGAITAIICFLFEQNGEKNRVSGFSPAVFLLLAAFGLSCFFSDFTDRAAFSLVVPVSSLALGYLAHCFVSVSDQPEKAAWRLFQIIGLIAFVLYFRSLALWVGTVLGKETDFANAVNELVGYGLRTVNFLQIANGHPFGHPNYTAGFSLLTLPLVVSLALSGKGRSRIFWGFVSLLGLATLFSSGSRAGTLGLVIALLGAAVIYLRGKVKNPRHQVLGVVGAIFLAAVMVFSQPRIRATVGHLVSGNGLERGDQERWNLLTTGFQMGAESPLWGNGPGTTPIIYPAYWEGTGSLSNAYQLHSTPLQVWADLGILGILGCVGLLLAFFHFWRRFSILPESAKSGNLRLLIHGSGLGVTGYFVFSLTDYQLDVYLMAGLLGLFAGIFSGLGKRKSIVEENYTLLLKRGPIRLTVCLGLVVIGSIFEWKQINLFRARSASREALSAWQKNDGNSFLEAIRLAERLAPEEPYFHNYHGWLAAEARQGGRTLLPDNILVESAMQRWEHSIELFEAQEFCHYNLGWLHLGQNPDQSAHHFRRAAQINPGKRGVYFGLALALKKEGFPNAANRALALECLSHPTFATLPLWESPNFQAVVPEVKRHLWGYYREIAAVEGLDKEAHQKMREAEALTRWWWGEPFDSVALASSPNAQLGWWGQMIEGVEPERDDFWQNRALAAPIVLAYLAWKEPDEGISRLSAAKLLAMKEFLPEKEGNSLMTYLGQHGKSYPQLILESRVESALPLNIYRNTRLAFGLMGHNLDGPNPEDFFFYEQNLLLKITQVWLYPNRGYLPGPAMRLFLEKLPEK